MLIHNLKIAARNLMKYKLQTVISVLSIGIGILSLSVSWSVVSMLRVGKLTEQPYYERACRIYTDSLDRPGANTPLTPEIIRALKAGGAMRSVEGELTYPNGFVTGGRMAFSRGDSVLRTMVERFSPVDAAYPHYAGHRSAITGEKIRRLKEGEGIVSRGWAEQTLGTSNPIGVRTTCDLHYGRFATITIVDVYETPSIIDPDPTNRTPLLFCVGGLEDLDGFNYLCHAAWANAVLREGCSVEQLKREADERLKPLGLTAWVVREKDELLGQTAGLQVSKPIILIVGSLTLVAAIIGFLRMQVQLFWMRRRELSLRVVNGASRRQLVGMLMTEVLVTLSAAAVVAVMAGAWLEDFICTFLYGTQADILEYSEIKDFNSGCIVIWLILALVCTIVVWLTARRVTRADEGLAAHMRKSRSHAFRNMMMGVQLAISILFVSASFSLMLWAQSILEPYHMESGKNAFEECVLVRTDYVDEGAREQLFEEVDHLPSVERVIRYFQTFRKVNELVELPQNPGYTYTLSLDDEALLDLHDCGVEWFDPNADHTDCALVDRNTYQQLQNAHLVDNGTLTFEMWQSAPVYRIAGTFDHLPYCLQESSVLTIGGDMAGEPVADRVVVGKGGRYTQMESEVSDVVARLCPDAGNPIATNMHGSLGPEMIVTEAMRNGGCALGLVSLVVCAMSIYSAIALDTRGRRKEVAIRKINGAKGRHIAMMFGRLYIILTICAMAVSVPLSVVYDKLMASISNQNAAYTSSHALPAAAGALTVILLVVGIVGWQVSKIMRVNPAEIIAKE